MGQDIHAFIVYEDDRDFARMSLRRDYLLFALLRADDGVRKVVPPPRGLPGSLSPDVIDYCFGPVVRDPRQELARAMNRPYGHYDMARYHALDLTRRKNRTRSMRARRIGIPGPRSDLLLLNPDLHSHGWLDVAELERVAEAYRTTIDYGVHQTAWLSGYTPPRRNTWAIWRFCPQGSMPDPVPIPWWGPEAGIPGPVIRCADDLARLRMWGILPARDTQHLVQLRARLDAEGQVQLVRYGYDNGPLGPHAQLEAAIGAMRALPRARLVFCFDN